MSTDLPTEIAVIETDGGRRYVLPRPDLGLLRTVGWVVAAFGLAPIGMGSWIISVTSRPIQPAAGPELVGYLVFLLTPLLIILFGCGMVLAGVWFLFGHCRIDVTADEIRSAFCLGPLAWRERRPLRRVRRLVVEYVSTAGPGGAPVGWAWLSAETDEGRPLLLALAFPRGWLLALAGELAGRCGAGTEPLPVIEREASRATSRRWRRRTVPGGVRLIGGCFWLLWGGTFFSVGAVFFVVILQDLFRGDPGNNLQGAFPLKWLWALFPVPFMAIGAGALLYNFRRRRRVDLSPEEQTAVKKPAAPRGEDGGAVVLAPAAPEEEYPTVPKVEHTAGTDLAVRLTAGLAAGCGVALFLVLVLVCSGILTSLATYAVGALRDRQFQGAGVAGFFLLFVGVFWVLVVGQFVKEWRLWRLGYPVVEVSALPLYCGETCDLLVTVPGPARLTRLRVAVVCEEEASYTEGTTTRKETRRVHDQELARHEGLVIERGERFSVRGSFHIPHGAMHSFAAGHNQVRWVVRVEGEAQQLFPLKFTHDYPLGVRPPRGPGGRA
jgi:hypothetical protein